MAAPVDPVEKAKERIQLLLQEGYTVDEILAEVERAGRAMGDDRTMRDVLRYMQELRAQPGAPK